jgi:hypothetical protein
MVCLCGDVSPQFMSRSVLPENVPALFSLTKKTTAFIDNSLTNKMSHARASMPIIVRVPLVENSFLSFYCPCGAVEMKRSWSQRLVRMA